MLSTRKYLGSSMALSLLFHLLLFTVADKLPAYQNPATVKAAVKKRKPPRLSSVKSSELKTIKKTARFNLNLKKNPSRLSASLKANLDKKSPAIAKPVDRTLPTSALLGTPQFKTPTKAAQPKKLPESFYHIDIKSPIKTSNTTNTPQISTPKIAIKSPTPGSGNPATAGGGQVGGTPRISIRRPLPSISPSAIKFKKTDNRTGGRHLNSPINSLASIPQKKGKPQQMEHFLNITPYVYIDNIDQMGYFKLDLKVNDKARGLHPIEKDTYFIIDSSRSITRKQLTEFIRGTINGFSSLSAKDRFNPVIFTVKATTGFPSFKEVSPESIKEAREFLSFFRIFGGQTDIYNSIKPFINNISRENNRPLQVFLMTDGVSTVKESKESSEIIKEITRNNRADISIFGFSFANNTDSFLMDFLTFRNRGDSLIREQINGANTQLSKYISDRSEIIVTDLQLRYNGSYKDDTFPKKLPHLYRNRTLSIYGTFNVNDESSFIQLLGQSSSGERQLVYKINFNEARQASPELAKTWAAQKIFHLIGQLTDKPDEKIINEIYSLQQRFKVYIPYTLPKPKKQ